MTTSTITRLTGALAATVLSVGLGACSADAPAKGTDATSGDNGQTTPAISDGSDAGAVAASFVEASYANDLDRAAGMLAGDADIDGSTDLDDWRRWSAWNGAIGRSLADQSCREGSTSSAGTEVRCSYAIHALGSGELGRGPYEGAIALTVLDGKVTHVADDFPFVENGFSVEMWEPFARWVSYRHRDDLRVMYDSPYLTGARMGSRSLQLWEQRVADYVAAQRSSG